MTEEAFLKEFAVEWTKFKRKPVFEGFIRLIEAHSPARQIDTKHIMEKLNGATVYLGEVAGFEALRRLIVNLGEEEKEQTEIKEDYRSNEIQPR